MRGNCILCTEDRQVHKVGVVCRECCVKGRTQDDPSKKDKLIKWVNGVLHELPEEKVMKICDEIETKLPKDGKP